MKLSESAYYDGGKLISYNVPINCVAGVRSFGKTYYFKRRALKNFIKNGQTWAYMRRYDTHLKKQLQDRGGFFSDMIINGELPEWEYRVNGPIMECRHAGNEKEKFRTFGQFFSLNSFDQKKGSNDASMTMMVLDEFIKENRYSHYIPGEVEALMNVWETFDRREDRIKLYLLGNTADLTNPYFLEWGITITPNQPRFTRWNRGTVLLEYTTGSEEFRKRADESNIAKATHGTRYASMAQDNRFLQYDDSFVVKKKPPTARHTSTFKFQGVTYSIWLDPAQGEYFINNKAPDDGRPVIALTRDDMRPNMVMLRRSSPVLKTLSRMYRYGYCFFDSVKTKERFLQMLQLMGQL